MMNEKWDRRFMSVAALVSTWSKDPSTQIGAVIVNDERHILATGYNGFPKGIKDTEERLNDREQKYPLIVHAEMNALLNALYNGVSVRGATIYIYGLPTCSECAKSIVQAGISTVIMCSPSKNTVWHEQWEKTTQHIYNEAGLRTDWIDSPSKTLERIKGGI